MYVYDHKCKFPYVMISMLINMWITYCAEDMDLWMHEGYRWVEYGSNCSSYWVTWFSRVIGLYLIIAHVNSIGIMIGYLTLLCMKSLLFEDVMSIMEMYEIYVK